MTTKMLAGFLAIVLLLVCAAPAAAQKSGTGDDWQSLGSYVNREVAVKAGDQKTVYGILTAVDDSEAKVRAVTGNSVSEISFKRDSVKKIWLASLNESSRKTLKGAAIGAGIGAGAGLALVLASRNDPQNDDGLIGAAVPLFAIPGALIGGAVGFFSRQKHKKVQVIYKSN